MTDPNRPQASYEAAPRALPRRIAIVGCPGSGKTTLALALAERLALPHVELDRLYHQENWRPQDTMIFQENCKRLTPQDGRWIACGNYNSKVGVELRARSNHIIFLDLPKRIVMRRIIHRTFGRMRHRTELWNGNRESWFKLVHPVPSQNMILWTWIHWARYRSRYREQIASGAWAHAQVDHLQTSLEVDAFLTRIES